MAPPRRSGPRPGRVLAGLAVLIMVMLVSVTGSQTFSPGNWHKQFKVGLGLDLSSGIQIVLKAATTKGAPTNGAMQQAISVLMARVNGTGNSGAQVQQQGSDLINVSIPGQPPESVIQLVTTTAKLSFRPVLLEQYYSSAKTPSVLPSPTATPGASSPATSSPAASATATPSGAAKPTATASASPKASTADVAARLVSPSASASPAASASSTPTTSASPAPSGSATASAPASSSATATTFGDPTQVDKATMALFDKLQCKPGPNANTVDDNWKKSVGYSPSKAQWDDLKSQIVSCDASGNKYVLGTAVFDGTALTSVTTGLQSNSTQWIVNLALNGPATKAFGTLTTHQYNTYYPGSVTNQNDAVLDSTAIVLDGNVQSAPETQGALTSGQFTISGPQPNGFNQSQANELANVLKYGALPLSFTVEQSNQVSPQLGHDSLTAGLIAGVIGLLLVVLYMFYYYRGLGIVAVSSLLTAALLAYLSVVLLSKYQGFTLELSGIAGLVVAIGITADSFIVYFERLRDEVRDGKALRPAVEAGWKRARRTILVSDTVSFIAALLLYHFAVSDVQGFAYTLGLTTLIDVVVVFLFTKPMVTLLAGTKFFGGGHKWSGLDPERLGARTPWRSSTRRTVRTQRTTSRRSSTTSSPANSSTSTREA